MSTPRVLISGASVAGPALAYWLVRAGCKVTIVERAISLRATGQGIDIRDSARDVTKRMGIWDRILEKSSHEHGFELVDSNNRCFARFGVDESGKGNSFTSDVEILRGELAKILFNVTKDDVTYIFGDMVESMQDTEKEVIVNFANGTPTTTFDLVVAADGIGSKIRGMAFGDGTSHVRSLGVYVSYFAIPPSETDTMWSRAYIINKGRQILLRPDNVGRTRAFLISISYDKSDDRLSRFEKASKESISAQKSLIQEVFQDAGWETARVLKGMHESDDFYLQHAAQIRLNRWSNGRVSVVGDAGYAPSPFTGMGTSLAFIGAYVLAGEISRQPDNIPAALEAYERVLRPYVESIQKLPPGVPWLALPQSNFGVKVLETIFWTGGLLAKTGTLSFLSKLAAYLPIGKSTFKLPDYEAFKEYVLPS